MQIRKIKKNIDMLLANKEAQAKISNIAGEVLKERTMSKCPTHRALMRINNVISNLVEQGFTSSEISRILKKSGIPVSAQTIRSFCVRQGYINKTANERNTHEAKTMQTSQPQQTSQSQQAQLTQQNPYSQKQPQHEAGASRASQVQQQKQ